MRGKLQSAGAALTNALAILPLATLLLGLGYWLNFFNGGETTLFSQILIFSGNAILHHLALLFALGISFGLSHDKNGFAALSGAISLFVLISLLSPEFVAKIRGVSVKSLPLQEGWEAIDYANALMGILAGIIGAISYNTFSKLEVPESFAFFSGRRLACMVSAFLSILISGPLYYIWPTLFQGLYFLGEQMTQLGALGAGLFGFFNRLLIPTGLHHALNSVFWFDILGISDIQRFWSPANDLLGHLPTIQSLKYYPGIYQAGFFPITIFGLPGAALAIYRSARSSLKKKTKGILITATIAIILTGVTEPLEFTFLIGAPILFLIHAIITGFSLFLVATLKIAVGFGFMANIFDLLLSLQNNNTNRALWIFPIGLFFFALYYFIFRWAITRFNLNILGQTEEKDVEEEVRSKSKYHSIALNIIEGLGGFENIRSLESCTTRLRVQVKSPAHLDYSIMEKQGVIGIIKSSREALQIVIGTNVQFVYDAIVELEEMYKENFPGVKDQEVLEILEQIGDPEEKSRAKEELEEQNKKEDLEE